MSLPSQFAIAKFPTPILNTPHFREIFGGSDGASLPLDNRDLLRAVETVALPQTKFELLDRCSEHIFRVKTRDYAGDSLYADSRFLSFTAHEPPERAQICPTPDLILHRMKSLKGMMYVWGGSWPSVPYMLDLYPPARTLEEKIFKTWAFHGVDCSGLLYWATDGSTPRNTSELVSFGKSLPIEGKSLEEIQKLLRPLDLITWKGHVIIVMNQNETIESLAGHGVVTYPLSVRLNEIEQNYKRRPVSRWVDETCFVINRWFSFS